MKDLSKSLSIHLPTHCDTKKKKRSGWRTSFIGEIARAEISSCVQIASKLSVNFSSTRRVFFGVFFFARVFARQLPQTFYFILFFIFYLLSYIYREKIDTDGDGSISKEEFIRGYSIWQMHIKKAQMLQVSFFFFTKQ